MIKNINNTKNLIVSHIADVDGMGSVVLAKKYFGDIDYILVDTFDVDNIIKEDLSKYEDIFICDVSLNEEGINYFLEHEDIAKKIKHFDHHESEVENNKYYFFNEVVSLNGRLTCGTELFYEYLKTVDNDKVINNDFYQEFVEGIRNNDTWDFVNTGNTLGNELSTLLGILGPTNFINIMSDMKVKDHFILDEPFNSMVKGCEAVKDEYLETMNKKVAIVNFMNYKVGLVIAEQYRSHLGHYICEHNDVDFAIIIRFDKNSVSMRTNKDGIDLGKICESLSTNGGGHMKAASFKMNESNQDLIKNLVNLYLDNTIF